MRVQSTPFPARPCDVVPLTPQEFTRELVPTDAPSIDAICQRFVDDTNRALVWLIRFEALTAWRTRPDMAAWLISGATREDRTCELAASFTLNEEWEFDAETFRAAVESTLARP